ncbi:hypothetical protein DFH29DRAFT_1005438 [Suillus ampliporus]|nr:hypothetical protein DFH29DRAFT_1005438 [Suillus ampliporus]
MNEGLKPQWDCVQDDDPHMQSHPFFHNTIGYIKESQPAPKVTPAPAPKVIPGAELGRKKCKVSKPLSKTILSSIKDEDWQPGGTIPSKIAESALAAPPKSKGMTKGIKQKHAKDPIGHTPAKGKGKEKAKEVAKPIRGCQLAKANAEMNNPPCQKCISEPYCVVIGRRGQVIKSCSKCHHEGAVQASMPHPRSKAAPDSKSKVSSRRTRATSCACPLTPILESEEEAVKDTDEADIKPNANAEQHTDIETKVPAEEKMVVNEPQAITSVDDFPANHWVEPHSDGIPTPPANTISPPSASLPPTISTIHEYVLALTAQVAAMQMADQNAIARVDGMEQDFDTRISSMCMELSSMQLDVNTTMTLVNGLVCLVEKLWQDQVVANPSFPALVISHVNGSLATTLGLRYLNSVFSPSVGAIPMSVGVGQTLVSHPFSCPDMQGSTFMSGQASSVSAPASPSHAIPSPASAAQSLP